MLRRLLAGAAVVSVIAVVLVQFAPVLAGRVYRFEDIADYFEPLWTAAAREMGGGRVPLWDGGAWSGYPLVADPQVGAFYPPNWLWLALPVLRAYAVCVLLHAAWGGIGMYVLARLRGRSPAAAAAAGIALAVGGYMVLQVRHVVFIEATAWLPWVGAAAWPWLVRRDRGALAATAAAGGMLLLTGGVSMIYYGLWFLGALLLPRAREGTWRDRAGAIGGLVAAAAVAALLAAPSLLPAAAQGRISPRALGVDEHFAGSVAWSGLGLLPSLFVPNLLGQQVRGDYVGGGTQWEVAGYYAGMATFALAALALVRGPRERRGERIAFLAVFALAVALAPGERSPVFALAFRALPGIASMRCPPRALYVFALGVPLLAADGLDLVAARLRPRARAAFAVLVPSLIALDLLVAHHAENPTMTVAEAHARAFPPVSAFLRQQRGDRFANDVHLDHALHNAGLLWGLDGASGYSSVPIWRYLHYLWIANHGAPYPHARLHDDLSAQGLWRFSSPLVDALNVRWVIARDPPDGAGFVRRFVDADGVGVWENRNSLPRGFLLHRARIVDDEAAAARAIAEPGFDPRHLAVLERAPDPMPRLAAEESSGQNPDEGFEPIASFEHPETGDESWGVDVREPALLVMSLPACPGWRATLDGRPVTLLTADLALLAVAVPPGAHIVQLTMTSRPVDIGLALGGVGALALIGLSFVGRRRSTSSG